MQERIICPYCFANFYQDEVLFRAETCFTEDDILDDYDIEVMPDGPEKVKAKIDNDLKKEFLAGVHPRYQQFWERFNGTTEQTRRNSANINSQFFENYQKPIISPKNPRHVLFDNIGQTAPKLDRDGFLSSVTDRFGKRTSNRVCPECCNPLPMNYGKFPVKFISIIGITGAGKTVYLSSLLDNMHIYAGKIGMTPLPNDAVNFFIETNKIAKDVTLPQGTPAARFSQPLCYNLQYFHSKTLQRETSTFVLYDIAGENCVDPAGIENFGPFISRSDGIIILQDPKQFDGIYNEAHSMIDTVLQTITNLFVGKQYCDIPLAMCISKADRLIQDNLFEPALADMLSSEVRSALDFNGFCASEYNEISRMLNDFYFHQDPATRQALRNGFDNFNYFAVSSLNCELKDTGARNDATDGEPLLTPAEMPHPLRIEEPLFWLFTQFGFIQSDVPIIEHAIAGKIERLNQSLDHMERLYAEVDRQRFSLTRRRRLSEIEEQIKSIKQELEDLIHSR